MVGGPLWIGVAGAEVVKRHDIIEIAGLVRHETDLAIFFDDGTKRVWLPKSMVEVNDDGTVSLPEWLAEEKELI